MLSFRVVVVTSVVPGTYFVCMELTFNVLCCLSTLFSLFRKVERSQKYANTNCLLPSLESLRLIMASCCMGSMDDDSFARFGSCTQLHV